MFKTFFIYLLLLNLSNGAESNNNIKVNNNNTNENNINKEDMQNKLRIDNYLSSNLYPSIKSKKFEKDYRFINSLWFHSKCKNDFDRDLSQYVLVADKSKAKLYLYFYNGETKLLKTYNIVSGEIIGDKEKQDDKKTPEGIYFFEYLIPRKDLLNRFGEKESKQYGPLAVTLNYPNPVDKIDNKTGNGIWIHGVEEDTRVSKKFDTRGCIATANIDVPNITNFIQTQTTPILVFDNFKNPKDYKVNIPGSLIKFIKTWEKSWEEKDIDTYISLYDESFKDTKGRDKTYLRAHKSMLNKVYSYIKVNIFNLSCYKHSKYSVCQFFQEYYAPGKLFKGIKRIYLKENNNNYKILSEEFVSPAKVKYLGKN